MAMRYILYGCLKEEKAIEMVFTFIATHNPKNYGVAAAAFSHIIFSKCAGKIGKIFPFFTEAVMWGWQCLEVLLDFSQSLGVGCSVCRCGESVPVHTSFPLNAVCTTHFMLLALSCYESEDHMCNMQTEINPVGKRK